MKYPEFTFDFSKRNAADDIIDTLIEKVLVAYPPERIERIRSRAAWTWNSKSAARTYDDRISYLVLIPKDGLAKERPIPEDATEVQRNMIGDLLGMLRNADVDDEFYPAFNSGCQQVTIPSMFGCVKECISDSDHIKPILKAPSDVYSLPTADIREGMMCHTMLWNMAYKYQRAGKRIPVYMTDVQGPFSCAAQIWGIQDFLCDLEERRNEAHHLLSLCTDAIIHYFHAMGAVTEGNLVPIHCHPVLWVPKDCGVAVSDDFFAVVGKHTVAEFSAPYLDRIGEAFGGVTAHTCGNMNHLAETLNAMKHLKAVNFGNGETDITDYAAKCDPRITILSHKSGASCLGLPLYDTVGHLKVCAKAQRDTGVKVFATCLWAWPPDDIKFAKTWEDAARL